MKPAINHFVEWKPSYHMPEAHDLILVIYFHERCEDKDTVYGFFYSYYAARDQTEGYQYFKLVFDADLGRSTCYYGCTGDDPPVEYYTQNDSGLGVPKPDREKFAHIGRHLKSLDVEIKNKTTKRRIKVHDLIDCCDHGLELDDSAQPDAREQFAGKVQDLSKGADPLMAMLIGWKLSLDFKPSKECASYDFQQEQALLDRMRRDRAVISCPDRMTGD